MVNKAALNDENYKKEYAEAEARARAAAIKQGIRHDHRKAWFDTIEQNPKKLFYALNMAGAGVFVQTYGLFDLRFLVEPNPEYKAVENVIKSVVLKGFPLFEAKETPPFNLLFVDSDEGDRVKEKIFKAYNVALAAYKWCAKEEITLFEFAEKYNPEFGTMLDYELEKFFQL